VQRRPLAARRRHRGVGGVVFGDVPQVGLPQRVEDRVGTGVELELVLESAGKVVGNGVESGAEDAAEPRHAATALVRRPYSYAAAASTTSSRMDN
jgi:hypothetical protein